MKNYRILIAFGCHAENETIALNDRQAKFLLLSGHIVLIQDNAQPTAVKPTKKVDV